MASSLTSSFLQFAFLLFTLVLGGFAPADCRADDPKCWKEKLRSTKMPSFLRQRLYISKSHNQLASYIQNGQGKAFCEIAQLSCNPNDHFSNASLPFYLQHTGSSSALKDLYFKKSDVQAGKTIAVRNLHRDTPFRRFLPQFLSKKLPFSKKKLASLLKLLNIPPSSPLAKYMRQTLSSCEKRQKKQTKACVTSLEDMIGFLQGQLGSNLHILQTKWLPALSHKKMTVIEMALKGSPNSRSAIICSDTVYPYSVFECHVVQNVKTLEVTMQAHGSNQRVKAVMQCSAAKWHVIEEVTFVPALRGEEEEFCHWMSDRDLVFVSKGEGGKKKKMIMKKGKKEKNMKKYGKKEKMKHFLLSM